MGGGRFWSFTVIGVQSYCFMEGKAIGSSLVLREEDEKHIKGWFCWIFDLIKLYESESYLNAIKESLRPWFDHDLLSKSILCWCWEHGWQV